MKGKERKYASGVVTCTKKCVLKQVLSKTSVIWSGSVSELRELTDNLSEAEKSSYQTTLYASRFGE